MDEKSTIRVATGVAVIGVVLLVYNWSWISSVLIRSDLKEYARQVRASRLSVARKIELLDAIDGLSDKIDAEERIGLLRWWETNEVVKELLAGGLNEERAVLFQRELGRVQQRLK